MMQNTRAGAGNGQKSCERLREALACTELTHDTFSMRHRPVCVRTACANTVPAPENKEAQADTLSSRSVTFTDVGVD